MKKLFSFLAIIGIILASNCSRIPENNDPVIGIWTDVEVKSVSETEKQTIRQEWIFNDAYLGRYHTYVNKKLDVVSDFKWSQDDGLYTVSYPGLEKEDDIVTLKVSSDNTQLEHEDGYTLAVRE